MPVVTEGMITGCRPSLRCSRTTAERDGTRFRCVCAYGRIREYCNNGLRICHSGNSDSKPCKDVIIFFALGR